MIRSPSHSVMNCLNINSPQANGVTPLMKAAKTGDIESVKTLLANHVGVNAQDRDGDCAGIRHHG